MENSTLYILLHELYTQCLNDNVKNHTHNLPIRNKIKINRQAIRILVPKQTLSNHIYCLPNILRTYHTLLFIYRSMSSYLFTIYNTINVKIHTTKMLVVNINIHVLS